ncbi:hypothetical protein DFH09DRAFT_1098186 [Mycena vulgaris]|nr:hypothetical protein DFH09DRAFT_1098186 [Mycena vulgaris]
MVGAAAVNWCMRVRAAKFLSMNGSLSHGVPRKSQAAIVAVHAILRHSVRAHTVRARGDTISVVSVTGPRQLSSRDRTRPGAGDANPSLPKCSAQNEKRASSKTYKDQKLELIEELIQRVLDVEYCGWASRELAVKVWDVRARTEAKEAHEDVLAGRPLETRARARMVSLKSVGPGALLDYDIAQEEATLHKNAQLSLSSAFHASLTSSIGEHICPSNIARQVAPPAAESSRVSRPGRACDGDLRF